MRQLQDQARSEAWGLLDHPVLDLTGLTGAFDFAVTWVPAPRTRPPGGDADAAGGAAAPVPTGELTFFEALEKQLGLKLEQQEHSFPALVIDSAELPPEQ